MAASSSMCLCDWSKLERYTEELSDDDVRETAAKIATKFEKLIKGIVSSL